MAYPDAGGLEPSPLRKAAKAGRLPHRRRSVAQDGQAWRILRSRICLNESRRASEALWMSSCHVFARPLRGVPEAVLELRHGDAVRSPPVAPFFSRPRFGAF